MARRVLDNNMVYHQTVEGLIFLRDRRSSAFLPQLGIHTFGHGATLELLSRRFFFALQPQDNIVYVERSRFEQNQIF